MRRREGAGVGAPLRYGHHAGVDQCQPGEKVIDLLGGSELVRHRSRLRVPLSRLPVRLPGADAVREGQVAAHWQAAEQAADDAARLVVIADMPHDSHQQQRHGLCEVQCPGGGGPDALGIAQVGVDVIARALG